MFILGNPFFLTSCGRKVGLNYQELRDIGIKIKEFEGEKEVSFGSSYFEVLKIKGLDSTIFKTFTFSFYTSVSFFFLLSHKPPTF